MARGLNVGMRLYLHPLCVCGGGGGAEKALAKLSSCAAASKLWRLQVVAIR